MLSRSRARVALSSIVISSGIAFQAAPAQAQVVSGASTGWAIFADVDLLSATPLIDEPESPFLSAAAPAPYNQEFDVYNFENPSPCGGIAEPGCNITASVLYAQIDSNVDGGMGARSAHGLGRVESLELLLSFLDNITIESNSTVSGDSGLLAPIGTTTIASLTINGSNFANLSGFAPNTDLLGALSLPSITGVSLIVNEQIQTGDCITICKIETNGLHIVFDGGLIGGLLVQGDIILAHSEARLTATAPVVPVPAAVWLFGSGLLGLVGVARRKTIRA